MLLYGRLIMRISKNIEVPGSYNKLLKGLCCLIDTQRNPRKQIAGHHHMNQAESYPGTTTASGTFPT